MTIAKYYQIESKPSRASSRTPDKNRMRKPTHGLLSHHPPHLPPTLLIMPKHSASLVSPMLILHRRTISPLPSQHHASLPLLQQPHHPLRYLHLLSPIEQMEYTSRIYHIHPSGFLYISKMLPSKQIPYQKRALKCFLVLEKFIPQLNEFWTKLGTVERRAGHAVVY